MAATQPTSSIVQTKTIIDIARFRQLKNMHTFFRRTPIDQKNFYERARVISVSRRRCRFNRRRDDRRSATQRVFNWFAPQSAVQNIDD